MAVQESNAKRIAKARKRNVQSDPSGRPQMAANGRGLPVDAVRTTPDVPVDVSVAGLGLGQDKVTTTPLQFGKGGGSNAARIKALRPPTPSEALREAASAFAGGVAEVPAGVLDSAGIVLKHAGKAMGLDWRPASGGAREYAQAIRDLSRKILPGDEDARDSFWFSTVPGALGSGAGFMAGGAGLMAAKVPALIGVMGLGAAVNGSAEYTAAELGGASEEGSWKAFLIGLGMGTTEALPLARMLKRINAGSGATLKRALVNMVREGVEESAQETAQGLASNIIAKHVAKYDEDREYLEGLFEGGAAGFFSGILLSGLSSGISMARRSPDGADLPSAADQEFDTPIGEGMGLEPSGGAQEEGAAPAAPTEDEILDALRRGERVPSELVTPEHVRRVQLAQTQDVLLQQAEVLDVPGDEREKALDRLEMAENPAEELDAILGEWTSQEAGPPEEEAGPSDEQSVVPEAKTGAEEAVEGGSTPEEGVSVTPAVTPVEPVPVAPAPAQVETEEQRKTRIKAEAKATIEQEAKEFVHPAVEQEGEKAPTDEELEADAKKLTDEDFVGEEEAKALLEKRKAEPRAATKEDEAAADVTAKGVEAAQTRLNLRERQLVEATKMTGTEYRKRFGIPRARRIRELEAAIVREKDAIEGDRYWIEERDGKFRVWNSSPGEDGVRTEVIIEVEATQEEAERRIEFAQRVGPVDAMIPLPGKVPGSPEFGPPKKLTPAEARRRARAIEEGKAYPKDVAPAQKGKEEAAYKRVTRPDQIQVVQPGELAQLETKNRNLAGTISNAQKRLNRAKGPPRPSQLHKEQTNILVTARDSQKSVVNRLQELRLDAKLRTLAKAEDAIIAGVAKGEPEHLTLARTSRLAAEHMGDFERGTPMYHNLVAGEERALQRLQQLVLETGVADDLAQAIARDAPGFYTTGVSSNGAVTDRLGGREPGGVPNAKAVPLADLAQAWKDTVGIVEASNRMEDAARRLRNQNLPGSEGPYGSYNQDKPWEQLITKRELGPDSDVDEVAAAIDARTAELEEMIAAGKERIEKVKKAARAGKIEEELAPIQRIKDRVPWAEWMEEKKKGIFLKSHWRGNVADPDSKYYTDGHSVVRKAAIEKRGKFFQREDEGSRHRSSLDPVKEKHVQEVWDKTSGGESAELLGVIESPKGEDGYELILAQVPGEKGIGGVANARYLRNIMLATGADSVRLQTSKKGKQGAEPWAIYKGEVQVAALMPIILDETILTELLETKGRKWGESIDPILERMEQGLRAEVLGEDIVEDDGAPAAVLGDPEADEMLEAWGDSDQWLSGATVGPEELPASMAPLHPPRPAEWGGGTNLRTPIGGRILGNLKTPEKPLKGKDVNQPQIIHALSKVLAAAGGGTPIRVGRMGTSRARGFFMVEPEVIRIKQANNISTAAHEVGHALEKHIYGWVPNTPWKKSNGVTRAMQEELIAMGRALYQNTRPAAGYRREGFAEFIRLYVSHPHLAEQRAPKFHGWFESTFSKTYPLVRSALQDARGLTERWSMQGSVARMGASIIDPAAPKERVKRGLKQVAKSVAMENIVDTLWPFKAMGAQAEKILGRPLRPSESPYFIGSALRTTQSARVAYMVERGMIDFHTNVTGPGLHEVRALVKGRQRDFTIYLWAKRTRALLDDPKGPRESGASREDAIQVFDEMHSPKFEMAAQKVYDWEDGVLTYAAQSSPTIAKLVARVRKRDPGSYIPLQREFEELDAAFAGSQGSGGSIVQRMKGAGRRIKEPFSTMIANAERTVAAAHRRAVLEAVVNLSKLEGMGNIIVKVPAAQKPLLSKTYEELLDAINEKAMAATGDIFTLTAEGGKESEADLNFMGEALTFFAPTIPKGEQALLPVWNGETGQMDYYEVSEKMLKILGSMDIYRLGTLANLVGGIPARLSRAGWTGLRASFGLLINPTRDAGSFWPNTRSNARPEVLMANFLYSMSAMGLQHASGGTYTNPWADAWMRTGGVMAQPLGQDIPHTRRAARRLFQGSVVRTVDPRNWFDFYRDLIQFPEGAPRVAELKLMAQEIGWEPGQPMTFDQSLQLTLYPAQVTTDFKAGGYFTRMVNQVVPFHTAGIQGPRAHVRAYRRNPGRFLLRSLVSMTIPALLLWWYNKDKQWWRELPLIDRFMFWHFEVEVDGREERVRVPRAFELGGIFAALPEALADAWYTKSPEDAAAWFANFGEVSVPNLEPVLWSEVRDQDQNRDRFLDRPIVSGSLANKPEEEQATEYSSRVAVALGETFGKSPVRIDHAIRGIFGGVAHDVIDLVGAGSGPSLLNVLGLTDDEDAREKEPADIPILGRLFARGGTLGYRPRSVERLYKMYEEADIVSSSDRHEETEDERRRRLLLMDATRAISLLSFVRGQTTSVDERRAIMQEITNLANEAQSDIESGYLPRGKYSSERKSAQRRAKELGR